MTYILFVRSLYKEKPLWPQLAKKEIKPTPRRQNESDKKEEARKKKLNHMASRGRKKASLQHKLQQLRDATNSNAVINSLLVYIDEEKYIIEHI